MYTDSRILFHYRLLQAIVAVHVHHLRRLLRSSMVLSLSIVIFEQDIFRDIADVVAYLSDRIIENCVYDMVVRRSHVLSDALRRVDRAAFDPRKRLNVQFTGIIIIHCLIVNACALDHVPWRTGNGCWWSDP